LTAENYLLAKGVDITKYTKAVVFEADEGFNRYLQHATGLKGKRSLFPSTISIYFSGRLGFLKSWRSKSMLFILAHAQVRLSVLCT